MKTPQHARHLRGFGISDVESAATSVVQPVAQPVESAVSSGARTVEHAATETATVVTPVAQDVANRDNAAAVSQVGSDLNRAGIDNSCNDNTVGSKVCNGVFGGAAGANSVATDAVDAYTPGSTNGAQDVESAGKTVSDSLVKSTGYEINAAGQANGDPNINNCQGESVTSDACKYLGGAKAVNGEVSGAVQVTAAALAGQPDATGVQEITDNAAPAAVNDVSDAARSNGVDTSCNDGSATASACQAFGGADAVNNAAADAAKVGVQAATDGVSGQDSSNDSASSSPSPPPSSSDGSCCCWDTTKNPGKSLCQDNSNWCGSGCD